LLNIRKIFAILNVMRVAAEKTLNDCILRKMIAVETE